MPKSSKEDVSFEVVSLSSGGGGPPAWLSEQRQRWDDAWRAIHVAGVCISSLTLSLVVHSETLFTLSSAAINFVCGLARGTG